MKHTEKREHMKNEGNILELGATLRELLHLELESLERETQKEEQTLGKVMAKSFYMRWQLQFPRSKKKKQNNEPRG